MSHPVFFFWRKPGRQHPEPTLPEGYTFRWWSPSGLVSRPSEGEYGRVFQAWSLFHGLKIFWNRDYSIVEILHEGRPIHRSCVFPGYFRFPFMERADLQVGDTFTDEAHRGKGLAVQALLEVFRRYSDRTIWYLCDDNNAASIRAAEKSGLEKMGSGVRTKRLGLSLLGRFVITDSKS